MLVPDVNILLGAFREDAPEHASLLDWLTARLEGAEQVGVSGLVLSGVIRISTHLKIWDIPATPDEAVEFCRVVRAAPSSIPLEPGPRHWDIFVGLVSRLRLRANQVPDAYLAALALENGATFVTRDRGFARFEGLRLLDPLAA